MDALEALKQSIREYETRLRQVGDDQWDLPTPCTEWTVRDLANHMLLGTRMSVQLLAGGSQQDVIAGLGDDLMADCQDPVAEFAALAAQMQDGFAAPDGLEGTVDHPMGEIPRTTFVGFRIMDNGTHAWDLARAIGADETLDANLVSRMWDDIQPMADGLGELGMFGEGASGDLGEDAPLQTRYLDLVGRRP
ncbi:MAG: TIGR03086 family metal-binding protein [Acidimicrobiia bacterium]|nr:TIGR03086 family metal-binding protein [Acidimicrobiia bacterium]